MQIYNCHQIWQKKFSWISIPIRDQARQSWTCWQFHVRLKKSRFCKIVQDKCLAKILLLQNSNITKHNWSIQLSRKNLQIILGQVLNEILTHSDWNIERQMNLFFGSWEVRHCYITFERRRNWLQTKGALRKSHNFSSNRDFGRNFQFRQLVDVKVFQVLAPKYFPLVTQTIGLETLEMLPTKPATFV